MRFDLFRLLESATATIRHSLEWITSGPLVRWWRGLPLFLQLLSKSIAIGVTAAIFLHVARPYVPGIVPAERAATDWAISFWKDRPGESPRTLERFVFLDIDEPTYQQWGEQLFVPRDKLLRLIQFAVEARAKLLVVDVELTKYVGSDRASPPGAKADHDEALRRYLDAYSREALSYTLAARMGQKVTPIIFVRSIGQPLLHTTSDARLSVAEDANPLVFPEERPSEFLEAVISASPILHWASSLIEQDDDGVLRNWRLFEPTCVQQQANVVPSIALLTWALLREPRLDDMPFSVSRFRDGLRKQFSPPAVQCGWHAEPATFEADRIPETAWRLQDPLLNKSLVLSLDANDLEHRIFYKFHADSIQAAAFSRVRAALITDPQPGRPLSVDWLTEKVVVIGSSYAASNDRHATPLGEMPGALVVINQINALLEYGQIRELDPRIRWAVLITLIVAFSFSFSYFTKSWGTRVARFIVNGLFVPLSLWLFQYGWWLDIVFPLLVLQAYGLLVDFEVKSQTIKRKHGGSK